MSEPSIQQEQVDLMEAVVKKVIGTHLDGQLRESVAVTVRYASYESDGMVKTVDLTLRLTTPAVALLKELINSTDARITHWNERRSCGCHADLQAHMRHMREREVASDPPGDDDGQG